MNNIINFIRMTGVILLFICAVFTSCTEEPTPTIAVSSVTLDATSMTLIEGESQILTATVFPSNAKNQEVTWTSSNSSVASVKDGLVTAVKPGKATVTVQSDDGGKTATCEVTVNAKVDPVESISLDRTSYEMTVGDEVTLKATVMPENATNKKVVWSSSNTKVAAVADGKVTALKAGTATITVKTDDGGKTATCEVTVNAKIYPVESISLDRTSYEMTEGDEVTLKATVMPENATNKKVFWSSSNTEVAAVADGKITALRPGQTTITAKTEDGEMTATCEVTVKKRIYPVESIALNKTNASLMVGDEMLLEATITPSNATDQTITWSSSNPEVVSVDNGNVKALQLGTAVITVTTQDGEKTASCTVSVVNIDSLVSANFKNVTVNGSMEFVGSYIKMTAGTKMGISLSNNSTHDITVTDFVLICGLQNVPVDYSINETILSGRKSLNLTVTLVATMYSPIAEFTYRYGDETYKARVQFNGFL